VQQALFMADRSPAQSKKFKKSETSDNNYSQQYENITSSLRINTLLRPLLENHTIITANIPGNNRLFSTALLAIDSETQTITIDELNPKEGHQLLINAGKVELHTLLDGVEVSFQTSLESVGRENGIAFYQLAYPNNVRYLQRRSSFRVTVSAAKQISVQISYGNKSYVGELSDISAGGMCIRFPSQKTLELEKATEEVECQIKLPDKGVIRCFFKVCHSNLHKSNNRLYIGGRFENLDKIQRRTIEKFVVELQRKSRQTVTR
jgi:c-di-GMP-binding flagellar brake protein YcgR